MVDGLEAVDRPGGRPAGAPGPPQLDRRELQVLRRRRSRSGFPFDSTDGQRIRQVLTSASRGDVPPPRPATPPTMHVGRRRSAARLPRSGSVSRAMAEPLTAARGDRLAALAPGPPAGRRAARRTTAGRGDLDAQRPTRGRWAQPWSSPCSPTRRAREALARLADRLRSLDVRGRPGAGLPAREGFSALSGLTPASVVRLVRDAPRARDGRSSFAGGTNQNFSDINRDRPDGPGPTAASASRSARRSMPRTTVDRGEPRRPGARWSGAHAGVRGRPRRSASAR